MNTSTCTFIPPYLLERLAGAGGRPADACRHTLEIDAALRQARATAGPRAPVKSADGAAWVVHTAGNSEELPGRAVRSAGEPDSGDEAVDECAAGLVASLALSTDLGRDSYDGKGAGVVATVHYGRDYVNAFWDGTQLVFGDGDGEVFARFTKALDVVAHEFGHAVTQYAAGLVYEDQPGALNESLSDVFAACVKQRLEKQTAGEADWLIGEGLFLPKVKARALRDMAEPGTAYDDPELGKDPQVGHMDDFVTTEDDNGGVHLNSGIPNKAFHLAATAIGGMTWEGAGRIWWQAWTDSGLRPDTDFAGFAAVTIEAAGDHVDAVRKAWADVGVEPASSSVAEEPAEEPAGRLETTGEVGQGGGAGGGVVRVRRSGGFAGRTTEGSLTVAGDAPTASEARALLASVHRPAKTEPTHPDAFNYTFELPGEEPFTVPEHQLDDTLARLARTVLSESPGDI